MMRVEPLRAPKPSPPSPDVTDLRLIHLADSALPIGALAHSFGLESLTSTGRLEVGELRGFLHAYLEEGGVMEAAYCRAAFRLTAAGQDSFSREQWLEINEWLSALKPARESRQGSAALGKNFLQAVLALGEFPVLQSALEATRQCSNPPGAAIHHSTAFGLASGALSFDEDRSTAAYLHQLTAGLVSACQRLLPLGQTEAMRILWDLKPAIREATRRSASLHLDDVCCFAPLFDWGAMEHPALSTRLFIS
jgi:urease accessory protein